MDIKIGQVTYDPFAESCKAEREALKYEFQKELGFRILGSKVWIKFVCFIIFLLPSLKWPQISFQIFERYNYCIINHDVHSIMNWELKVFSLN